jgi:glycosyltransferase involved in cell wall biosynthesis
MKKKLVIVTDTWHPQVNGVVTSFENIIPILEKDFEVSIIHSGQFWTVPLFFYPEIRLSPIPYRKMYKMISELHPDYIHIATEGPLGLSARIICTIKKLKFTTSYHTHFSQYVQIRLKPLFGTVNAYISWFHNAAHTTMVGTKSLQEELSTYNINRTTLWPLGVNTTRFQKNTELSHVPIEVKDFKKPIFAYFGRVAIEKNIEEFLQLDLPGTKLVIGEGPQEESLKKAYPNTIFTGYKRGQELVDWLSNCDALVFPSITDTFGLVIIEALAMGIPVAAHDVTGPKDIISSGVDGYLDSDLKSAALKCLELNPKDCRKKALQFSWEHSAELFRKNLVAAK